jgi:3-phenylpropionate/trans-cinnamate dioxygenase ferredoxin subunit
MTHNFIKVARVGDIKPGKMQCVKVAGRRYLLANIDGSVYATDDTCTHEDASLSSGSLHGEYVKCPLHNSRFNVRTGQVMEDPATQNLVTRPVRIDGDDILIDVS